MMKNPIKELHRSDNVPIGTASLLWYFAAAYAAESDISLTRAEREHAKKRVAELLPAVLEELEHVKRR